MKAAKIKDFIQWKIAQKYFFPKIILFFHKNSLPPKIAPGSALDNRSYANGFSAIVWESYLRMVFGDTSSVFGSSTEGMSSPLWWPDELFFKSITWWWYRLRRMSCSLNFYLFADQSRGITLPTQIKKSAKNL